ncbi:Crp/Fnr family transcriptional regulator [Pararhodobacter sp. SW119]|uniref:Crp/Fnr family transcriptional regulator n=1 Tax=Pararhodobacter sp. SW119 TaxID=2780075 RepID=UPI001FD81530|nr:Crp/Fnr family transcriptional regulator [Pararhodobacter sp. SW119]
MSIFLPFSESEVRFMTEFRDGEVHLETGQTLYHEGDDLNFFYTVLSGQGARYKFLPNGGRQLVNFLFPGDLTGLQGLLEGQASTTAVAACPMVLCRFRKTRLPELFRTSPSRAYALTWVAAVEEHFLGETITTLGQRTALQRIAWALLKIHSRLTAVGLARGHGVPFPFRQRDLADALGLSLVHTNKMLARLRNQAQWEDGVLRITEARVLAEIAMVDLEEPPVRPLL